MHQALLLPLIATKRPRHKMHDMSCRVKLELSWCVSVPVPVSVYLCVCLSVCLRVCVSATMRVCSPCLLVYVPVRP